MSALLSGLVQASFTFCFLIWFEYSVLPRYETRVFEKEMRALARGIGRTKSPSKSPLFEKEVVDGKKHRAACVACFLLCLLTFMVWMQSKKTSSILITSVISILIVIALQFIFMRNVLLNWRL